MSDNTTTSKQKLNFSPWTNRFGLIFSDIVALGAAQGEIVNIL